MIRNAFGSDENGQLNGFPNIPNKIFMEEVLSALFPFSLNCFSFFRFVILIILFLNSLELGFLWSRHVFSFLLHEFKNWEIFSY